eukprot:COSAG03_NODE_302_length_9200_cov_3.491704_3_plen_110_part_00
MALGLWGEQSAERAKLFRLNPHLPAMGGSGANTPLKAGTRVNLTSKALKQSTPDQARAGEGGLSMVNEKFEAPKQVTTLFSPVLPSKNEGKQYILNSISCRPPRVHIPA